MSTVLLKKIKSAGGIPQTLLQCSAFWNGLQTAAETWAKKSFAHELSASFIQKSVIGGRDATAQLDERFGYICLPHSTTGLRAISIDRHAAGRYASARLGQSPETLATAPPLFLRLMADHPARALWSAVAAAAPIGPALPEDFAVADPASVPDSLGPDERFLQIGISLSGSGAEDGWLLEGEEDPPEIQLYFEYDSVRKFTAELQRKKTERVAVAEGPGRERLRKSMRSSTIGLNAVLEKMPMTIAECSRLEVGQVVQLPGVEPGVLSLCAETMHGPVAISQGELGAWKGKRALKLKAPLLESFVQEIAEI